MIKLIKRAYHAVIRFLRRLVRRLHKPESSDGWYWVCSTKHETVFPPSYSRVKRCDTCGEVLR